MTLTAFFESVVDRLAHSDGSVVFGADEIATWPDGAFNALWVADILRPAEPARVIECHRCERRCFMEVHVYAAEVDRLPSAFVSCDKPEDYGRIVVELARLAQFQISDATLATAVARLLRLQEPKPPKGAERCWALGAVVGESVSVDVHLSLAPTVTLSTSTHAIPLTRALVLTEVDLRVDERAISELVIAAEVPESTPDGRSQKARRAADARHERPGGAREKQRRIRELWASGKYSSRDLCAEQEFAGLGMSYASARRALRNTPEPSRS